jgi:futalosine hydrolase
LPGEILKKLSEIKNVKGLTLNTVSGEKKQIKKLKEKFDADIETMEGAAFFYVMKHFEMPFVQIRVISNAVEPRDKNKWSILKAQVKLSEFLKLFLLDIMKDNI